MLFSAHAYKSNMWRKNKEGFFWQNAEFFQKKIRKSPKKHLQRRETCAIIILGCERLGQIAASVLRKPRYALMREVAATALG